METEKHRDAATERAGAVTASRVVVGATRVRKDMIAILFYALSLRVLVRQLVSRNEMK